MLPRIEAPIGRFSGDSCRGGVDMIGWHLCSPEHPWCCMTGAFCAPLPSRGLSHLVSSYMAASFVVRTQSRLYGVIVKTYFLRSLLEATESVLHVDAARVLSSETQNRRER